MQPWFHSPPLVEYYQMFSHRCSEELTQILCIAATEMQVVEVLNPLARTFKSIRTLRKEFAELQQELAKAHNQVCYRTGTSHQEIIQYGLQ